MRLSADEGPLGTKNYRIQVEAVPLDAQAQRSSTCRTPTATASPRKIAMQAYLGDHRQRQGGLHASSTASRRQAGLPVGGVLGVLERNTMRYYLAIDAYLSAYSLPAGRADRAPDPRVVREHRALRRASCTRWTQNEYLEMKRKEMRRQQQG